MNIKANELCKEIVRNVCDQNWGSEDVFPLFLKSSYIQGHTLMHAAPVTKPTLLCLLTPRQAICLIPTQFLATSNSREDRLSTKTAIVT